MFKKIYNYNSKITRLKKRIMLLNKKNIANNVLENQKIL